MSHKPCRLTSPGSSQQVPEHGRCSVAFPICVPVLLSLRLNAVCSVFVRAAVRDAALRFRLNPDQEAALASTAGWFKDDHNQVPFPMFETRFVEVNIWIGLCRVLHSTTWLVDVPFLEQCACPKRLPMCGCHEAIARCKMLDICRPLAWPLGCMAIAWA